MTRFQLFGVGLVLLGILSVLLLSGQALLFAMLLLGLLLLMVIALGVSFPWLELFGRYPCNGSPDKPWVALTFDDGPDPGSTPALLDLLAREKVPATFFCIGSRVADEPGLARRLVEEGHQIGNHSFKHSNFTNFYTVPMLVKDFSRAGKEIEKATGINPSYFRPPMGLTNPPVFRALKRLGLTPMGWTVRSLDTKIESPDEIVRRIARWLKPGAIILLHDGKMQREKLCTTVTKLLAMIRKDGYTPVRLDAMIPLEQPMSNDQNA